MRTIWKYELEITGLPEAFLMPQGARVLHVGTQGSPEFVGEKGCLWAEVETLAPRESRYFQVFGTGHEVPNNVVYYAGTFQLAHGEFVGHVYEVFV